MKILLFYFSGAGYTRWAVNKLSGLLVGSGHTVHVEAVEHCDMTEVLRREDMIDCIGFAQPIYAADLPRIMRRVITAFLEAAKAYPALPTQVFFLNTYAYVNGHGVAEARKLFRQSPFRIQAYVNVKMPNSACGKKPENCPKEAVPGDALAAAAIQRLKELADSLGSGRELIHGVGPQHFGGKLVRRVLRRPIANTYRRMHVDAQRCMLCMRCISICPVQSIRHTGQGFQFTADCEACMRCVHACPPRAISVE